MKPRTVVLVACAAIVLVCALLRIVLEIVT
jgi:hypothetical protein